MSAAEKTENRARIARFRDPTAAGIVLLAGILLGGLYFLVSPAPVLPQADGAAVQKKLRDKNALAQAGKRPVQAVKKAPPTPAPAFKVFHEDGALNFADRKPDFLMDSAEFITSHAGKAEAGKLWKGPKDLSMKVWVGHDDSHLIMRVDVIDDKHWQKAVERGSGDMYFDDSIQLALTGYGWSSQWEFGFALSNTGRLYRHLWLVPDFKPQLSDKDRQQALESIDFDMERIEGGFSYRLKFPFKELHITNDTLTKGVRMDVLYNDSDDTASQRKFWMELTTGIASTKENTTFAEVKFGK